MAIDVTADDVRGVLGVPDAATSSDPEAVSDSELSMPIRMAEAIVNDSLDPYSDETERLTLTGAALAAAYYYEEGSTSSVTQGDGQVSFDTEDALSYWRQAVHLDPTGRLDNLDEGDTFLFETT